MKFVSFQLNKSALQNENHTTTSAERFSASTLHWGVLEGEQVRQLSHLEDVESNLLHLIEAGEVAIQRINQLIQQDKGILLTLNDIKVMAPFLPKKNIICVGKNYEEHALEMSNQDRSAIPEFPVLFTKPYTAIVEHQGVIKSYPELTQELDYEGELVIVIGKKGTNITKEAASQYIFGYSILNDVTARDLQKNHKQFFKGKSLDTFAPFGPYVVHHTAIADPQQLGIKTYVNDELRQNGSTKDMIFNIAQLIEVISSGMTLEPGDMIATGTPSGVGKGFKPPRYIRSGDQITIEIEQIGRLINIVR